MAHDELELAQAVARSFPEELKEALLSSTAHDEGETPWWETFGETKVGRPFRTTWGVIMVPIGGWHHQGSDHLQFVVSNDYEIDRSELLDFVEDVAAGRLPKLGERGPIPDFTPFTAP